MAKAQSKSSSYSSPICTPEKHKNIVRGLGLRKLNQVVERPDTPGIPRHGEEDSASASNVVE